MSIDFQSTLNSIWEYLISEEQYIKNGIDFGAAFSLVITIALIWWVNKNYTLITNLFEIFNLHKKEPLRHFTLFPLLAIVGLSILLTIRSILYSFYTFIFTDNYGISEISILLGWLLTTNLSITLFNTFSMGRKNDTNNIYGNEDTVIKGMFDTIIKSIMIGLLTYLQKKDTVPPDSFIIVLGGLLLSLIILLLLKRKFYGS